MAQVYEVVVHYTFKKGMEEKGVRFLETELVKHAQELGCHTVLICQNERHPNDVCGIAAWNSIDEARNFQSRWAEKEKTLISYCSGEPRRDVWKIRSSFKEKKAA